MQCSTSWFVRPQPRVIVGGLILLCALFSPHGAYAESVRFRLQPFTVIDGKQTSPQLDLLAIYRPPEINWLGYSSYTYLGRTYALSYAGPEFYPAPWAVISTYVGLEQAPRRDDMWRLAAFTGLYGKRVSWTTLAEIGGTGWWLASDLKLRVVPSRWLLSLSYRRFVGLGLRSYHDLPWRSGRSGSIWVGWSPWDPEAPDDVRLGRFLLGMIFAVEARSRVPDRSAQPPEPEVIEPEARPAPTRASASPPAPKAASVPLIPMGGLAPVSPADVEPSEPADEPAQQPQDETPPELPASAPAAAETPTPAPAPPAPGPVPRVKGQDEPGVPPDSPVDTPSIGAGELSDQS